jgi:hypothetical protein
MKPPIAKSKGNVRMLNINCQFVVSYFGTIRADFPWVSYD